MNLGYMIYQAEHPRSSAEQREVDRRNGELAAAVTRRWQRIGAALSGGARGAGQRPQARVRPGNPRAIAQGCR